MKYGFLGLGLILVGMFGLVFIVAFESITINNESEYYTLKEAMEASMLESIDWECFRRPMNYDGKELNGCNGQIKISEQKFVENFTRRFANSVVGDASNYRIEFYDIMEMPPKASIKIVSKTQKYQLSTDDRDVSFNIVNNLSGILEINYKGWDPFNSKFNDTTSGSSNKAATTSAANVNKVSVTLLANGGTINGVSTITVSIDKGSSINLVPVRSGFKFSGWCSNPNNNIDCISNESKLSSSGTYYAHWTSISASTNNNVSYVSFDSAGGSDIARVVKGSTVNLSDSKFIPTKSGYQFLGWYTSSSGGDKLTGTVTLNNTVYAHWQAYKLSVSYNGNGGTWSGNKGTAYSAATNGDVLQNNAKFIVNRDYGIAFHSEYGLADYNNPTAINFSRSGYTVTAGSEWNTKADGTGGSLNQNNLKLTTQDIAKAAGCDLAVKNCSVVLYVNWKPTNTSSSKVNVSFNANNGTINGSSIQNVSVNKNASVNLDSYKPVRTGYTFAGWYTNPSGGSKISGSQKITGNVIYYAHWTAKVITVNFYRNTSTSDTTKVTQKFTYGKSGQKFDSTGFSRTGYTLSGWSLKQGGTKNYAVLNGVGDSWIDTNAPSINLYAVWTANASVNTIKSNSNGSCYTAKAKTVSGNNRVVLKTITSKDIEKSINVTNPSCNGGNCTSFQGMALSGDKIVVFKVRGDSTDSSIMMYSAVNGAHLKTYHVNGSSLGHANGATMGPDGKIHVVTMTGKNNVSFSVGSNNSITFVKSGNSIANDALGVSSISGGPSGFSGIAYDAYSGLYYFSKSGKLYEYDVNDKKVNKSATRFVNTPQDIGAYNGIILSVHTIAKNSNYLDLFRASDMAYVGSYHVTIPVANDIESVVFYNGKMILNANDSGSDKIHILKAGTVDFKKDCTK